MSEKKQNPNQQPNNVIQVNFKCLAEDCKKKPNRANFCDEHYEWFKEGLITIDGYKAKDFEKKYMQYMSKKSKKTA